MSAAEVAHRLDDGHLLVGGARTAQPRHQSLAAAIDWSYRLLTGPEQQLFDRMSVFAGGAEPAAVHAVCAEPGGTEADTLDLLTALVDKSMLTAADGLGGTRFHMLETLRAYGRRRLPPGALPRRHAEYYTDLAEQAARGLQGPDERIWVERTLPDPDNLRAAFEFAMAARDTDLAIRFVASLPEVTHFRLGYESAGWAERALEVTPEDHPLFVAAAGAAARGAWSVGDFGRARHFAGRVAGRAPARGTARSSHPADVVADIALYEGDVDAALRHYEAEVLVARADEEPIRLVWTLYYVAVCQAVRRFPERGLAAARECVRVAVTTGNPTALSMSRYALGLVLKKSDPARALTSFDEAADLAASVYNVWWQSIARMEAASTRSVHGADPAVAARAFVEVLDDWDRVGDRTQQWLNLRYVVRLLVRLGDDEAALTLHRCLLAAGKPSPLHTTDTSTGPVLSAARAVSLARARLLRVG